MSETMKQIATIMMKRNVALQGLVGPAKAAVNQMRDAGMVRGAGPLEEALFTFDVADAELLALVHEDPKKALQALMESMGPPQ